MVVVRGEASAWHQTMHVRVVMKVLSPGMKLRQETNLSSEEFGIPGRSLECLGRGPEKNVVNGSTPTGPIVVWPSSATNGAVFGYLGAGN